MQLFAKSIAWMMSQAVLFSLHILLYLETFHKIGLVYQSILSSKINACLLLCTVRLSQNQVSIFLTANCGPNPMIFCLLYHLLRNEIFE